MEKITIATRGSRLALWQAEHIRECLEKIYPRLEITLIVIKTKGDKILDVPLANVGGKGLFVKELEEALLAGLADVAVHSMKDMPIELPAGLCIAAITEREDPTDMFLSTAYDDVVSLPQEARVGTSSLRRKSQLLAVRPDLNILSLRGNIDTRLHRLTDQEFDAIIMATAGIKRLGLSAPSMKRFLPSILLPAVGQGALGLEVCENRKDILELVSPLDHMPSRYCVEAERSFLAGLNGGCQVPIAGYATLNGPDILQIEGVVAEVDGSLVIRKKLQGSINNAKEMGLALSEILISEGANTILDKVQ